MMKLKGMLTLTRAVIAAVAALLVVIIVLNAFALNFTVLACIAVFVFLLALWIMSKTTLVTRSVIAMFAVGIVGCLCLKTLHNYIYSSPKVFTAVDQHAVRLDGVAITNPQGFVLAGDNNSAFFDNEEMQGTLTIAGVIGDSAVVIRGEGFTRPVYTAHYDKTDHLIKMLDVRNPSNLITFMDGDQVTFVTNAGVERTLGVYEKHEHIIRYGILPYTKDSTIYTWNGDTTMERRFLKQSLPLSRVIAGVYNPSLVDTISEQDLTDSICLSGISLIRQHIDTQAKVHENYEAFRHSYALDIQQTAFHDEDVDEQMMVSQIRVGDRVYSLNEMRSSATVWYDTIPVGKNNAWLIGSGLSKTRPVYFEMNNGELQLEFCMPFYKRLSVQDNSPNTISMVATSIDGREESLPDDVTLFELFSRAENGNNMRFGYYLSYSDAPSTERLHFSFTGNDRNDMSQSDFLAGTPINGVLSENGQIRYLIQVQDFSQTTPFTADRLFLFLTLVIIAFVILLAMNVFGICDENDMKPYEGISRYTHTEHFAYIVILFFLTIRLFLLWRTSVFPPTDIDSAGYFFMWQNAENLRLTVLCASGLIVGLFVVKFVYIIMLYNKGEKWRSRYASFMSYVRKLKDSSKCFRLIVKFCRYIIKCIVKCYRYIIKRFPLIVKFCRYIIKYLRYIVMIFLWGIAAVLAFSPDRSGKTLLTMLMIYLVVEWILSIGTRRLYEGIDRKTIIAFNCSLINGLVLTGLFMKYDSGYGVVFFLFFLSWVVYNLWTFFMFGDEKKLSKYVRWVLWILLLALVLAIAFSKQLVLSYYDGKWSFYILVSLTVFLFGFLFRSILNAKSDDGSSKSEQKKTTAFYYSIVALIAVVCAVGSYHAHDNWIFKNHTKQRVLVQIKSPFQNLSEDVKNASDERRFIEASTNDWVLDQYNKRGEEVKPSPGYEGNRYFKMLPHSIVGALWGAQATDIALARFVIAEHSGYLAFMMVAMAFGLLVISISLKRCRRTYSNVMIQIPLLMFIHMLLVWMSNTRRFIFFGQDFPMVSITSKFSLVYFFGLLLIWLLAILFETGFYQSLLRSEKISDNWLIDSHSQYKRLAGWTVAFVAVALGVVSCTSSLDGFNYQKHNGQTNTDKYVINELYAEVQDRINLINNVFYDYQDSLSVPLVLKSDMSNEMNKFYNACRRQIDDILIANNGTSQDTSYCYTKKMWKDFIDDGSHKNSIQSIIHLRGSRRFRELPNGQAVMVLKLAVRNNFMDMELPTSRPKWHGNVIEEKWNNHSDSVDCVSTTVSDHVRCYRLPASWTSDSSAIFLARLEGSNALNMENNPCSLSGRGVLAAARIYCSDIIQGNEGLIDRLTDGAEHTFARSIRINRSYRFVYPLREQFMWAYHFAEGVKGSKMSPDSLNMDLSVTFDYDLMQELYERLGPVAHPRCVVVADGNGRVRAMVDRKPERYTLNPNHYREMREMFERLYLEGDPVMADRYFATVALQRLVNGPGSSQKPLVWTAVASGMPWGELSNLCLIPANQQSGRHTYKKYSFVGGRFYRGAPLRSSASDESSGGVAVGISNYMSNSSNFYNAVMSYLGSLDESLFRNRDFLHGFSSSDNSKLLRLATSSDMTDSLMFPIVSLGNQRYVFTQRLTRQGIEHGLLTNKMHEIFGLPSAIINGYDTGTSRYPIPLSLLNSLKSYYYYPQTSSLLLSQRAQEDVNGFVNLAVRATAVGAKVWEVTPFKMAEMFGRLATMNQDYTLTFSSSSLPATYHRWSVANQEDYWTGRRLLLQGMRNVFINGTAIGYNRATGREKATRELGNNPNGYYIYGKTGTIGDNESSNHDDHRLAVIITNQDLTDIEPESLGTVRYFVVYFAFDHGPDWDCYKDCVLRILNSASFQHYMTSN